MAYISGSTPFPTPLPPAAPKRSQNSIVSFRPHYRIFPCKITSHQAIRTKNRENSRVSLANGSKAAELDYVFYKKRLVSSREKSHSSKTSKCR